MTATLKPAAEPSPLLPPDETTWRRYSAHKEGEMSWLTSGAVHVLVIGVLIALGILWNEQRKKPPTNEGGLKNWGRPNRQAQAKPVVMDNPNPPGKGNPGGPGGVAAQGENDRADATAPGVGGEKLVETPLTKLDSIDVQRMTAKMPEWLQKSDAVQRAIQTGLAEDQMLIFRDLNEKVVAGLNRGLQRPVGDPSSGGIPGGDPMGDPSKLGGDPNGSASSPQVMNERQKRMYRWKLNFPPTSLPEPQRTELYLRQLDGLSAIVAIPTDRNNTRFKVIRKLLQRPARPMEEDPGRLGLIYWYETNPARAQNIAHLLGVQIPFGYIILMPRSLEATMEKLERAKAPPGINTDDIVETRFQVIEGGGGYTVECVEVRTK